MQLDNKPIVIGGLGGSGTRLFAGLLQEAGVHIGSHLNKSLDNLWFTFLFRRPSSFPFSNIQLDTLFGLFEKGMAHDRYYSLSEKLLLLRCAVEFATNNYVPSGRLSFPASTLASFFKSAVNSPAKRWGWKEPNSHLFLQYLLNRYSNLKYIHVIRHPLDAVYGSNYLQYHNWAHYFIRTPRSKEFGMLDFYEAVHTRVLSTNDSRILVIRFEDLIQHPSTVASKVFSFAGLVVPDEKVKEMTSLISNDRARPRYNQHSWSHLEPRILEVATKFGYTLSHV